MDTSTSGDVLRAALENSKPLVNSSPQKSTCGWHCKLVPQAGLCEQPGLGHSYLQQPFGPRCSELPHRLAQKRSTAYWHQR